MLSLKTNYRFQDMLLREAARAEARGDTDLAFSKLDDALAADTVLKKSQSRVCRNTTCTESVLEFIDEFEGFSEPVNYSDMTEFLFTTMVAARRRHVRQTKLKKFKPTVSPRTNTKKENEE